MEYVAFSNLQERINLGGGVNSIKRDARSQKLGIIRFYGISQRQSCDSYVRRQKVSASSVAHERNLPQTARK